MPEIPAYKSETLPCTLPYSFIIFSTLSVLFGIGKYLALIHDLQSYRVANAFNRKSVPNVSNSQQKQELVVAYGWP